MYTRKTLAGRPSLALLFALGLGLALPTAAQDAAAQPSKPAKDKDKDKKAPAAEAPTVGKPVSIKPAELSWGIGRKRLGEIYDKVIDEDYKARYQKVQPGPETERIDAEVAEKKLEFRRTLTEFKDTTTGYDSTPLLTEYSYGNKEALMYFERAGKTRYFFFIQDKLWKIIDVEKLGEKSRWGKTFDEAVAKINKAYSVDGRVREADAAQGRPHKEVDWKDAVVQVRAIDWGNDKLAIGFQESATVANLATLRKNKKSDATRVDDKVKDAGRKDPDAAKPDDKKKPKK